MKNKLRIFKSISKKNIALLVPMLCVATVTAQTNLNASNDSITETIDTIAISSMNILPEINSMPSSFVGTQANIIVDDNYSLAPFLTKLQILREDIDMKKPIVRVVHIGDSHVRSHEYTPALNSRLCAYFGCNNDDDFISGYRHSGIVEERENPGIVCHCIGINGATSKSFTNENFLKRICKLNPDLIVISLGTNVALGNYNESYHYGLMENLYSELKQNCPEATLLYTTPPGAYRPIYNKTRSRRYRRIIRFEDNNNTQHVAATIMKFAADKKVAAWDLFNIVGGNDFACKNWLEGNYFKADRIHYLYEGYTLHGNLLYEALSKKYNEYVGH